MMSLLEHKFPGKLGYAGMYFQALVPLDEGSGVLIRDAAGFEELWTKPRWVVERSYRRGWGPPDTC